MRFRRPAWFLAQLVSAWLCSSSTGADLPEVTSSDYLQLNKSDGSQMFYAYYESQEEASNRTPILLWLQVIYFLLTNLSTGQTF